MLTQFSWAYIRSGAQRPGVGGAIWEVMLSTASSWADIARNGCTVSIDTERVDLERDGRVKWEDFGEVQWPRRFVSTFAIVLGIATNPDLSRITSHDPSISIRYTRTWVYHPTSSRHPPPYKQKIKKKITTTFVVFFSPVTISYILPPTTTTTTTDNNNLTVFKDSGGEQEKKRKANIKECRGYPI